MEDTQTLRVHVSHLRRKLEPHRAAPRYIITEPGVGFRFSAPDEHAAPASTSALHELFIARRLGPFTDLLRRAG